MATRATTSSSSVRPDSLRFCAHDNFSNTFLTKLLYSISPVASDKNPSVSPEVNSMNINRSFGCFKTGNNFSWKSGSCFNCTQTGHLARKYLLQRVSKRSKAFKVEALCGAKNTNLLRNNLVARTEATQNTESSLFADFAATGLMKAEAEDGVVDSGSQHILTVLKTLA